MCVAASARAETEFPRRDAGRESMRSRCCGGGRADGATGTAGHELTPHERSSRSLRGHKRENRDGQKVSVEESMRVV